VTCVEPSLFIFYCICFEYKHGKYIICIVILSTAEHQLLCSNDIVHNTASNPLTKILCVRGAQIFKENLVAILNFCRCWKGDMKQILHWGPTNIRHHCTKCSCLGKLVLGIFAPLLSVEHPYQLEICWEVQLLITDLFCLM